MGIGKVGLIINLFVSAIVLFLGGWFGFGYSNDFPIMYGVFLVGLGGFIFSLISLEKCETEKPLFKTLFYVNLLGIFIIILSIIETYIVRDKEGAILMIFMGAVAAGAASLISLILIILGFFKYRKKSPTK